MNEESDLLTRIVRLDATLCGNVGVVSIDGFVVTGKSHDAVARFRIWRNQRIHFKQTNTTKIGK